MSGMKKTASGVFVDVESLKALVGVQPNLAKAAEKEGSAMLLPGTKKKRGSSLRQVLAAIGANLGTMNTGMAFGFSAIALPQLTAKDSFISVNEEQASWIASLSAVTTPIGCLLSGYLMDAFGRRRVLVATQVPLIIGWLLIGFAQSLPLIYAGRLLVGLGSGMVGAPARVYTAEATQPHLRGMLAALASLGVSIGVTVEYVLGAVLSWKTVALISSLVPMFALLFAIFLPESPQWLMSINRRESCKKSLTHLRGPTCDIEHELAQMASFADKNNAHKPSLRETLSALTEPSAIKPFAILTTYFFIYQFSGINPVTFYAVHVFQDSGAKLDPNLATVILGAVRVVFTLIGCLLMRHCGRRSLTFISSIGCGLSMLTVGSYMYAGVEYPQLSWLPVASILVFIAVSTIGYLVVPWVMIGEVYPSKVRGLIGGVTTCCGHFFVFIVVKTYSHMQHVLSKHGTFWFYGTVSLTGTIFFYFFLPETKGKSLHEIEEYFSGRSSSLSKKPLEPTKKNRPIILKVEKGTSLP